MPRSKWDLADGTEDLTNDRSLLKTILVEGDGETAGRAAKVSLKYSLRLSDERDADVFDSSSRRKDGVLVFTLGRRKVIPALELVAHSMKLGEKCRVKAAAPYAFGSKGLKRKGVPPHATVYMEVELLHFEHGEKRKPFAEMTPAERFEMAKKCKEQGNALFKELKYDRAMAQYSQCIQYLAKVFYKDDSQHAQREQNDQLQHTSDAQPINGEAAGNGQASISNPEQPPEPKEEGFVEALVDENGHQDTNGVLPSAATDPQQPINSTYPMPESANEGEEVETLDVSTATQEGDSAPIPTENENGTDQQTSEEHVHTNGTGVESTMDTTPEQQPEQQIQPKPEAERDSEATKPVEDQGSSSKPVEDNGGAPLSAAKEDGSGIEEEGSEGPTKAEVSALHVTTLNNLSLCLLKLEQFKKAVESSSLALSADPSSFKAFYYRGRALVALGEWDKAREDLVAAYNLQRNNMGIRMEIQKLDRKRKQFEEKEKKQAAAMFA